MNKVSNHLQQDIPLYLMNLEMLTDFFFTTYDRLWFQRYTCNAMHVPN